MDPGFVGRAARPRGTVDIEIAVRDAKCANISTVSLALRKIMFAANIS